MPNLENKVRGSAQGTGVGTNAGVTVTLTGLAGQVFSVRGIQVSGDAAAIVTVESPASTVLYRRRIAAAGSLAETWDIGQLKGASGADVLVKISASTANCEASIQADKLPG